MDCGPGKHALQSLSLHLQTRVPAPLAMAYFARSAGSSYAFALGPAPCPTAAGTAACPACYKGGSWGLGFMPLLAPARKQGVLATHEEFAYSDGRPGSRVQGAWGYQGRRAHRQRW